jgi:septum formation protein
VNPARLILASTSPYRRALLARLGLPFEVIAPNVDETPLPDETAECTALRLAEAKARAAGPFAGGKLIVGSDQLAVINGEKLGKPGNHASAARQLQTVRGKCVVFHTALCLYNPASDRRQLANVPTTVMFREITDSQIERYLMLERPYDCAGSARIEALGIALVERVSSEDPTALIGLPLMQLVSMLGNEGIDVV